jgi:glycyl-tRNA synthetase beta chain
MEKSELLIELGTEEIPASLLESSARQLAKTMVDLLQAERLSAAVKAIWYTPRRLVVGLEGIPARQDDVFESVNGPARSVAFDAQGAPTRAALGFAQKHGVEVSALQTVQTAKGEYLAVVRRIKGEATKAILQRLIPVAIGRLAFPKTMHWSSDKFRFSRPIRWTVALFGGSVVKFQVADVISSRYTTGHRFLGKRRIAVASLEDLRDRLRENGVIVDPAEREEMIRKGLSEESLACGGRLLADPDLLQTVINLNEFPSVIGGSFEPRFLSLPQEILITVMREHQKYFSVLGAGDKLLPAFLAVINLPAEKASLIRAGHERVLRARLADAAFFWDTDRKKPVADREVLLKNVVFQEKLGSYHEKQQRVASLLPCIADMMHCQEITVDLQTAAHLFKCDLITEMVKEFTDLQGIVGGLYAQAEGFGENIWRAVYEQYQPKSTSSPSPSTRAGAILSFADRLDTVCGCFSVGLIPSSSGDPFAVRRQANGLLKILFDHNLSVSLDSLTKTALGNYPTVPAGTVEELKKFFEGRIRFLLEEMGFSYDCVNAVLASGFDDPVGALERVRALEAMRDETDFLSLASNFKRVVNILAQAGSGQGVPDPARMIDPAEQALWEAYAAARPRVEISSQSHDYGGALRTMASMRQAVDLFFDKVLVMAPDPEIKNNRLALLRQLSDLFLGVADISQIVVERSSRL